MRDPFAKTPFVWLLCILAACGGERLSPRHAAPLTAESTVAPETAPFAEVAAPAGALTPPSGAETPVAAVAAEVPGVAETSAGTGLAVEPPLPPAATTPTIPTAGAATCSVGEAYELAVVDRRRTRLAVSFRGDRGLAAWATDDDELAVRPIDRDARPSGPAVVTGFRRANGLEWLVAMPNGTIALSAGEACDDRGSACFQAIALSDDGHPLGPAFLHEPNDVWPRVYATAASGPWLFALHETRWGYGSVRYQIAEDGSVTAAQAPNLVVGGGPSQMPLRAVAASTGGRAFVFVEYSGDRGRGARLYDLESQHLLPVMRGFSQSDEGIDVDPMEIDGDAIEIVAERKYVRVGFDGRVLLGPERVRERAVLPEGLRDRMMVSVESRQGQTVLVRRDLARAEIGEAVRIARSPTRQWGAPYARVAWVGDHFVVVAGEPSEAGIRITSRTVECGSTP